MVVGCHLGHHHGGGDGVLVADIVAHHVAVALLKGEDVFIASGGLPGGHTLGHELEAGEGVLKVDAVLLRHHSGHAGGDDAGQGAGVFRQGAGGLLCADHIVQQQHAHLVAADGDILVPGAHHGADAVGVRVGADNQVAAHLLGQVDGQIEALGIFRVGAFHRGEAAVDNHLLGHGVQVLDAQTLQCLGHQLVAAAVEGGVNNFELVRHSGHGLFVNGLGQNLLKEGLVGLLTQNLDLAGLHGLVKVAGLEAGENVDGLHLLGDGLCLLGRQLGAVGPVDLVAVILLGVVAGGDVQTGGGAVVQHGKAQLRRGAQILENADVDAVCGHDAGGLTGKLAAVETAVSGDGDALAHGLLALGHDDVGKRLGSVADDVDVHVVQSQLHGAAQTGGAELQGGEEAVFDLLLVAGDGVELVPLLLAEGGAVQPALVLFFIIPHGSFLLHTVLSHHYISSWAQGYPLPGR